MIPYQGIGQNQSEWVLTLEKKSLGLQKKKKVMAEQNKVYTIYLGC